MVEDERLRYCEGTTTIKRVETLVGHAYVGWLSREEMTMLADMTKNMVKPRKVLLTLKRHSEDNVTIMNINATFDEING